MFLLLSNSCSGFNQISEQTAGHDALVVIMTSLDISQPTILAGSGLRQIQTDVLDRMS
jgi:hypothetical protein